MHIHWPILALISNYISEFAFNALIRRVLRDFQRQALYSSSLKLVKVPFNLLQFDFIARVRWHNQMFLKVLHPIDFNKQIVLSRLQKLINANAPRLIVLLCVNITYIMNPIYLDQHYPHRGVLIRKIRVIVESLVLLIKRYVSVGLFRNIHLNYQLRQFWVYFIRVQFNWVVQVSVANLAYRNSIEILLKILNANPKDSFIALLALQLHPQVLIPFFAFFTSITSPLIF